MSSEADSSLPIHIGAKLVDAVLDLKSEVGRLAGQIDGLNASVGDLHGRVSQSLTRDEFAALMAGTRPKRPTTDQAKTTRDWLTGAHKRIGLLLSAIALLVVLGGAAIWMANAYQTLQRAQAVLISVDGGAR